MRLDQFKVGDKVQYPRGRGPSDEYSVVCYIASTFVVLAPSDSRLDEFVVQQTDSAYGDFERYESTEDLRRRAQELRTLGFDLYTAIRDAAWTEKLKGPTPHMRSAAENWAAATGE